MSTIEQARQLDNKARTWRHSIAKRFGTQQQVALPLITLVVAGLVMVPLLILVRSSLLPSGMLPFDTLSVTLNNFVDAFWTPDIFALLRNTAIYAAGSVLGALVVASSLAWLVERTNLPLRTTIRVTVFSAMAIPPLAIGFGWIMLLNPSNGVLNILLRTLFQLEDHMFNVYTMGVMVFISATMLVPTMFVMLSGVFHNMDPQLETAGAVSGASYSRILRTITLPLLSPGILSVGIYMSMIMVQAFEIPLAIGLTAGVRILSLRIYLLGSPEGETPEYGLAAAFGIGLLGLAALLMWGYFRATRVVERFRVVTGKGFRPRRIDLGRWRYVALALPAGFICLLLAPLFMLLWASFLPFYQVPSLHAIREMTFDNYRSIFSYSMTRKAFYNTLILVFSSATLTMVLSSVVCWFSVRRRSLASRWLNVLAFFPLAIPNMVIALAILLLYVRTPLYGTIWIIVLAHVTAYLAFGTRTMDSALIQIHPELENAAITCGAKWGTMMRKILLPMLWPHLLNGWLWVVAHSMRDVTMALMLMAPGSIILSSALWLLWSAGEIPMASALLIFMIVGLSILVFPLQIHASRNQEVRA